MSRRYQIRTPPTSPLRRGPSSTPIASGASTQKQPRNDWERLLAMDGTSGHKFLSDEDLDASFLSAGHPPEILPELRKIWDDRCNAMAAKVGNNPHVIGKKPDPDSTEFGIYEIPHSSNPKLAFRIFDGGLERYGHFCLDYFDLDQEKPINAPPDYKICPISVGGNVEPDEEPEATEIRSWESAFDIPASHIHPGEEKFSLPEGSHWRVLYRGREVLCFVVPTRPSPPPVQFATPKPFRPRRHD